jgi:hypothetical protein
VLVNDFQKWFHQSLQLTLLVTYSYLIGMGVWLFLTSSNELDGVCDSLKKGSG